MTVAESESTNKSSQPLADRFMNYLDNALGSRKDQAPTMNMIDQSDTLQSPEKTVLIARLTQLFDERAKNLFSRNTSHLMGGVMRLAGLAGIGIGVLDMIGTTPDLANRLAQDAIQHIISQPAGEALLRQFGELTKTLDIQPIPIATAFVVGGAALFLAGRRFIRDGNLFAQEVNRLDDSIDTWQRYIISTNHRNSMSVDTGDTTPLEAED